jgi:hypothetical protein
MDKNSKDPSVTSEGQDIGNTVPDEFLGATDPHLAWLMAIYLGMRETPYRLTALS